MNSFTGLLNNVILLLALGVIYDALGIYSIRRKWLRGLLSGVLIGLVGIAVMLTPWELAPGIFFDTRWVLLSLCGLFFGLQPTLIAVGMTLALRIYQGGPGMYAGSAVIVVAAGIGLIWRYSAKNYQWRLTWQNLYALGLIVQFAVIGCMFLMPATVRYDIIKAVAPPALLMFPIGTSLLGLVLRRQRDRRAAEVALDQHRQLLDRERGLLRGLIDSIPDLIFIKNTDGYYVDCNQAFAEKMGKSANELSGKTDQELFDEKTAATLRQEDNQILSSGSVLSKDKWVQFPNGQRLLMSVHKGPFRGLDGTLYGLAGIGRDISERWATEKEREQLQSQLAQAQKIESVGQLAGGIAHDFNNMLAVILGQAELAKRRLDDQPRLELAISEIQNAAKHSSDLTQQLLAFARKQAITPVVMNLNDNVDGMSKMLRRVIGESIDLDLTLERNLWNVKMDSSQLNQILTNLCVNARDAIAGHGQISIETRNKTLGEVWSKSHSNELSPGDYVVISVNDDGSGIDEETQQKIFDPFFTTKAVGKGTGLGLATVYGIVKQNNGWIEIVSELNQGSTFKIYLPRTKDAPPNDIQAACIHPSSKAIETILLVEDEQAVLRVTKDMLEDLGYEVLPASSPSQALQIANTQGGDIHLLLTDVVMPEDNGKNLAENLLKKNPNMKILFMSGYTADVIAQQSVLDENIMFIEKPFSQENLAKKILSALGKCS